MKNSIILLIAISFTAIGSQLNAQDSSIQVVSPPFIDAKGNVWSGSGSGGGNGRIIGKAKRHVDQNGKGWLVFNHSNRYGTIKPRRAPQFDQKLYKPSGRYAAAMTIANPTVHRVVFRIRMRTNGSWKVMTLEPKRQRTFTFEDLERLHPVIGFDSSTDVGEQYREQRLKYATIDKTKKNQLGAVFVFSISRSGYVSLDVKR